ncbi:phosphotransferase family protein [Parvibaculum sp.]|jgi:aminoglycoside phosphotransferase (APT) family kinase protein|uniref:phosphotransferase family protein n=1 Tax=Parvibaculum sp. TaxID=2024848 RepID=UPI000C43F933|nr:phosphotransferase family protein [Parvibaculum sp.]MAM93628.1 phosphotransferase family protein [Parvibaculum sp.]|tara:strand:- start:35734 stop:36750 length:1017 start_codon:yes stop_codon:yes gene_type:complete
MAAETNSISGLLTDAVKRHIPGATGIADLRRLSGGASQEIWSFDATTEAGMIPLILRRAPGGFRDTGRSGTAVTLETEAKLISLAEEVGVPVPPVRYVLTEADGIGQGFIMDRIPGETLARKILRDEEFANARPKLARQCGEVLAKLHTVEKSKLPPLRIASGRDEVEQYFKTYKELDYPHPVFELAFRWLKDNAPPGEMELTLVHGDFRNGNLMIGPDGLRAVLDWEIAHVGDPMADLSWICINPWRFGNIDMPVGGFGTREDLFAGYEAAGGGKVDPAHVKFWEVLGTLKWGVMCMGMASAFLQGDRSVERATIGRRSSETEVDLMRLLAPLTGRE